MVKNTYKLLNHLITNKNSSFSIRELSKIFNIDYKTTHTLIHKLKNSLNIRKQSKTKFISFKPNLTNELYLVEKERLNNILNIKNFQIIYSELEKINEQFILLLFGSYVKQENTKNSDIDLLLISNNNDVIKNQLEILPLPLHITSIVDKEFISMLNSKKFSVVSEAIKNNVILFGIENYYRFLKNVN